MKLLSICVPVLNEEANIVSLYTRLCGLADSMPNYRFEFVFTDNHSQDNTWNIIKGLSKTDKRIRAFKFSRNVGFQKSIWMNYSKALGDAVIQIDADLQDPPELIHEFVTKWKEGYKVVFGIRASRQEGRVSQAVRTLGYRAINLMSEHPIPENAGDFRLLDRQVVDVLLQTSSATPYLRGTIASIGFKSIGIEYERKGRTAGVSKFPFRKVFGLGWAAVIENSTVPLKIASWSGVGLLVLSVAAVIYVTISKIFTQASPPGYTSLIAVMLFGFGLNALLLGVLGDYINRLYSLQRNYPMAVIEEEIN